MLIDLLRPLKEAPLTYFAEDADSILMTIGNQRESLSDKSLRAVLDFMRWPEDMPDPLAAVERYDDVEVGRMEVIGYVAVGKYLAAQNTMLRGPEERRDYYRRLFKEDSDARKTSGD